MNLGSAVIDAGPIFSFAVVDLLHIIEELFSKIIVPQKVWEEVSRDDISTYLPRITEFCADRTVNTTLKMTTIPGLGKGEMAVIEYSQSYNTNYLILDDKKARRHANQLGGRCIGTLGLLIMAKELKLINELHPIFVRLIQNGRYYGINLLNKIHSSRGELTIEL